MRKDIILPALAVVGGGLGFGLRRWQLTAAYRPDTQLFVHGHPSTYALVALVVALGVLFLALVWGLKGPKDFFGAYHSPSALNMTIMTAAALLLLGGGVLGLLEGVSQLGLWRADTEALLLTYPLALLLGALLCFPGGLALLLLGKQAYRAGDAPNASLWAVFPPLAALVWLFATHLNHGTDPVFMDYGFTMAAVIFLLLGQYEVAGFFHQCPHPRRAAYCALMGVVLGMTSLADIPSPFQAAMTGGFGLSALSYAQVLLRNGFGPPWPKRLLDTRMPLGAQQEQQPPQDINQEI